MELDILKRRMAGLVICEGCGAEVEMLEAAQVYAGLEYGLCKPCKAKQDDVELDCREVKDNYKQTLVTKIRNCAWQAESERDYIARMKKDLANLPFKDVIEAIETIGDEEIQRLIEEVNL